MNTPELPPDATSLELPKPPLFPAASKATVRRHFIARSARWALELCTVFIGVYAAFVLNNHQSHLQDHQRREQILAWMESAFSQTLDSVRDERVDMQKAADEFNRQVEAGQMPALHAFDWRSAYDPADVASVLSNGGFDLLEVQTVRDVNDAESTLRSMLAIARHDQQLSDNMILPNLEKERDVFYDSVSHHLRPTYQWYANFYRNELQGYAELQPKLEKLLGQIRAERQRDR